MNGFQRWSAIYALSYACFSASPALASDWQLERGRYLVQVTGCGDCHTAGHFFGKPDHARKLGGSDVGLEVPGMGTFVGSNLTPDDATGLGKWTNTQIVTAITAGVRPDGRVLAPVMPYASFSGLKPADAQAIAVYLKSLPPIRNQVPGPFKPDQKVSTFVFKLVPPAK